MRRSGRGFAVLAAACAMTGGQARAAEVVGERASGPRSTELTVATPSFAAPTKVRVLLPQGYEADRARRWPVVLYLAGTNHDENDFEEQYGGEDLTRDLPAIVVAPRGDSGYWSDWIGGGPRYETFVIDELLPLVDARYRTTGTRAGRAVLGESMGGYGTMMLAARHPDLFAAAASLSGSADTNLAANAAVLSVSPLLQGAAPDAIYGPRATEEVRWRGHNPVDLAGNLREVDLQVRTATGVPDPAETPSDAPGCAVEALVKTSTLSLHRRLEELRLPHVFDVLPRGCHSVLTFRREIAASLPVFERVFADPRPAPATITHQAIEPRFDVWGWDVTADPGRALEPLRLEDAGAGGFTLEGSGTTTVRTPPLFRGLRAVEVRGAAEPGIAVPDAAGRLRVAVDLGAPHLRQAFTPGADASPVRRRVRFAPHAVLRLGPASTRRACVRVLGGVVEGAVLRLTDRAGRTVARSSRTRLGERRRCRALRPVAGRLLPSRGRLVLRVGGRDGFGHATAARRVVRP